MIHLPDGGQFLAEQPLHRLDDAGHLVRVGVDEHAVVYLPDGEAAPASQTLTQFDQHPEKAVEGGTLPTG